MSYKNWDGSITSNIKIQRNKLTVIAGPCMLESLELGREIGLYLQEICTKLNINYIFKSSYDKANRTSKSTTRGPGLEVGLSWLQKIKAELNSPVLTDIHTPEQANTAAEVCDILQIPAFLFQQRELLLASAKTNKVIQIKKGQSSSPNELINTANFLGKCGNNKVLLCERGTTFGYNNLVVDYKNLVELGKEKHAVVFDATHSAQLPGAGKGQSSGQVEMVPYFARAAIAVGIDALFLEVHPNPSAAKSDAATQLNPQSAKLVIEECAKLHAFLNS